MWQKLFVVAPVVVAGLLVGLKLAYPPSASGQNAIISQTAARRYGLHRQWVTRAQVSRATDQVSYVVYDGLTLFVQSESGLVHAIDPETGGTQWIRQIGERFAPSTRLASSAQYVGLVSGLTVYVLDRFTGATVWEEKLSGVPGSTTALWGDWVYVPLITGMIEAYHFGAAKSIETKGGVEGTYTTNWFFKSDGIPEVPPVVSARTVAWATSGGVMYASDPNELKIRFQFEANGPINAGLVYKEPYFFAASHDGFLYAVSESTGQSAWQFSAGSPIYESPILIGDALYVIAEHDGMYRLSLEDGTPTWLARGVRKFIAASQQNLYTADSAGRTFVLDAQTGHLLNTIPTEAWELKVTNRFTDRIFVGSHSGLLHCLREIQLDEPVRHNVIVEPAAADEPPGDAAKAEAPPVEQPRAEAADAPADDAPAAANDPFNF